jgi:hypothetical protein
MPRKQRVGECTPTVRLICRTPRFLESDHGSRRIDSTDSELLISAAGMLSDPGHIRKSANARASRVASASPTSAPRSGSNLGRGRPRRAERGSLLLGDLVGLLLGDSEEFGNLDEADRSWLRQRSR